MEKVENGNPLIKGSKADTINEVHQHVEWLCLAADSDEAVHPGFIQSLHMVREAVKSLKG